MIFREGRYDVDCTPLDLPDGRFAARALLTDAEGKTHTIEPAFEPFATAAEASSAAHTSALAWIAAAQEDGSGSS